MSTWLSLSFRSPDISLRDMQLESASEEIVGSDGSEPLAVGMIDPLGFFGAKGPASIDPYIAPFSGDSSCRLRSAACSAMISATSADRGTVPPLGLGRLVAGSEESPKLASSLALCLPTSCADNRREAWVPPPGVVLHFPTGTTDFLFCLDTIAFLSSIRRAVVKSNCELVLIKASSSFLSMVLGQVLPF